MEKSSDVLLRTIERNGATIPPWKAFVDTAVSGWAKEMPLLFEQMTGYSLNDIQLNNAIAEWARRLQTCRKLRSSFYVVGAFQKAVSPVEPDGVRAPETENKPLLVDGRWLVIRIPIPPEDTLMNMLYQSRERQITFGHGLSSRFRWRLL